MKQSEKTMLEFAGYCFIHKPELANEINTLIADFINKPKEQLPINGVGSSNKVDYKEGFELAQKYIEESPCDPDIYKEQLACWDKYQLWLKYNKLI